MEQKIAEYLKSKYNPLAVILHGSRATGKNRPNSDWDIVVLVDHEVLAVQEMFDGEAIDVEAVKMPLSDKQILDNFANHLNNARLLFDNKDRIGAQLIEKSRLLASMGRELSEDEYTSKKSFAYRLLGRLESFVENDGPFFYHLGNFYQRALRYWFELKKEWSMPVYEALPEIARRDSEYYKHLTVIYSNVSNKIKLESARWLRERLFPE